MWFFISQWIYCRFYNDMNHKCGWMGGCMLRCLYTSLCFIFRVKCDFCHHPHLHDMAWSPELLQSSPHRPAQCEKHDREPEGTGGGWTKLGLDRPFQRLLEVVRWKYLLIQLLEGRPTWLQQRERDLCGCRLQPIRSLGGLALWHGESVHLLRSR